MSDMIDGNRFVLIKKYKQKLIEGTNIESRPEEMKVLDSILFRFWQMGWLDKLEEEAHWIPVTENTLPKENKVVVVCGEKGTWDFGTYRGHGDDIHFWHWKKSTYKCVYWWMYKEDALPEPYKEVTT